MSFLGTCMYDLEGLLGAVYHINTVVHMFSDKALASTFRHYLLVDSAFNEVIAAKTFNFPLPYEDISSICG